LLEILTNPNVAYLILVLASLLIVVAVFSPGSGVIELAALITALVAGYIIIIVPINYWALALLVVGVIPFLLAVRRSKQLKYLAIAIAAFVVGSAYLFGSNGLLPTVNPFLALVTSTLSAIFIWILATKSLEAIAADTTHNLSDVVGMTGEAKTKIHQEGSVYLAGEMWSARSVEPIPEGTRVRVVSMEGFMLNVMPVEEGE
jgi:membrane-bound serine protease (ClpP class)